MTKVKMSVDAYESRPTSEHRLWRRRTEPVAYGQIHAGSEWRTAARFDCFRVRASVRTVCREELEEKEQYLHG